jgi:hypothetical protein
LVKRQIAALLLFALSLGSMALFVSGLWFLDAFLSDGSTTAFLPFILWGVTFHDRGAVLNVTYTALISSFIVSSLSSFGFAWLLREGRL